MNFNLDTMSEKNEGVSPVIGVILMVAIVVILAAVIGVFVLDLAGSNQKPAQASVTFDEDPDDGLTVRFTENVNADSLSVRVNGSKKATLNSVGDSATVAVSDGDNVSVVGVNNGEETVLQTYTATQNLGNTGPGNVSGTVSYNPPVEGVTVKALDSNGNVVGKDTTDSSGSFTVPKTGNYTVNGYDVSTSVSDGTDIELDGGDINRSGSKLANVLMRGSGTSSDPYKIDSVSDLQAMETDTDASYILTKNIDASVTSSWNIKKKHSADGITISGSSTKQVEVKYPIGSNVSVVDSSGSSSNISFTIDNASDGKISITNNRSSQVSITINYDLPSSINQGFDPVGSNCGLRVVENNNTPYYETNSYGPFKGELNGNGYTVSNLTINRKYTNNVGLFGCNEGTVKNIGITNSTIKGNDNVGSIAGQVSGTINNVYSTSDVTGSSNVGGITGNVKSGFLSGGGSINQSYYTGSLTGSSNVGGIAGKIEGGSVNNSYVDSNSVTSNIIGVKTGGTLSGNLKLKTSEMQGSNASSNMSGFNFTNTWTTVSGDYPELQNN